METVIVSRFLLRYLLIPMVALWAYHLYQRRYPDLVGRKRYASLYLTLVLIAAWVIAYFYLRFSIKDVFLVPIAFLAAVLLFWQRKLFFPYRLRCGCCGAPLPLARILFSDSEKCSACEPGIAGKESTS